jgi:hypothetical protein
MYPVYNEPFTHYIIDDFLPKELALKISEQFLPNDSPAWFVYDNPLEVKKACNNWFYFQPETYQLFQYLNSSNFIQRLRKLTGINLTPDHGLHGAGLHMQGNGGKLNVHLDYSIHPKLNLLRKYNLIYYLTPEWKKEWGGNLEFWSHDDVNNLPKEKIVTIENKFNRIVLFDASQNSWHGFSDAINCPDDKFRKSIAMYYMSEVTEGTNQRRRALYSPTEEQKNNPEILNLIKQRTL